MNRFLTTWNYMKGLPKQLFFDKAKLNSRHFSPQNEPPCQAMNRFLKSIRWNYVRGLPIQSIFNQEKLNSCSIVAATECAYYAYIRENGRANLPAPFSVQQVLERLDSVTWRPRRRTKTGRKYGYGADPCDIFQYLKVYGVVDSIYYPYKGTSMSRSDVASYKSERRYYIRDYQELTNSNIDLRTVLKSSLIWVGFPVGKSFINYQTGIYRVMTQKEKQHLQKTKRSKRPMRHSIVIIGWGIENNEVVYLAKNSWGEKWGMKGLLKISESAIRQGCIYTCSGGYFKDIIKTNKKNQGVGASLSSTTRGTTGARRSGNVFVKLDITSSQLLVTENDVKTPEFRSLLSQTVNSLLALRSIPIFNENDAISTRRAPYEDSSGIFWDSDSLAALLALELKEDILVLLSEVEGLFSGPPSDPTSKLIHMYVKQKHHGAITFGNKSRVGRGGMTAKVKAAIGCAESGTPVIIASGFVARNIAKVLEGQRIGTLFHRDAHTWTTLDELGAHEIAVAARDCSMALQVITSAIPQTVGEKLIGLVTSKEDIPDLLKLDDVIDLVIPRGSNRLVSQIKSSTKIVVLGHSDGICHVYVDKSANMKLARRVVVDSKLNYPAACNAMETILVHQDLSGSEGLQDLLLELSHGGVTLYGGPRSSTLLNLSEAKSFHHEYNSRACTIEIVNDVKAAVDHIRRYGSGHIECIVAENKETAEYFLHQVDSAAVFHNASTRFCDGMRFGLGAEVGISTSKIHARGPVGLEGLLTAKWVLRGNGHVVQKDDGVIYTHKNLSVSSLDELEPDLATTGMLLEMDNSELLHRSVGFTRGPSSQGARRC